MWMFWYKVLSAIQGSHASWKVLESPGFFFCKISRPWKVLEILVEGPGKSWNFLLGYDTGGRHNCVGVVADAEICA